MPQHKSPKKHMRSDPKRRAVNRSVKTKVKTTLRKVTEAADAEAAKSALPEAFRALDRAAKRGTIKVGNASRRKSRLARQVARMAKA